MELKAINKRELNKLERIELRGIAKRRRKYFRPTKIPRYLSGEHSKAEIKRDLKAYNRHLFNCFYAEPVVDCKPPRMNPHNYFNMSRLRSDTLRSRQIDIENKVLIRKINYINRTGGKVDSFNPLAYETCSRRDAHKARMQDIVRDNEQFYYRLMGVESKYPKAEYDKDWKKLLEKMKHMAKYTLHMFLTKTVDQLVNESPSISNLEGGLILRKRRSFCFMDFRIKDSIPLGRIIIELYDDVVPKTCQNFLSICKGTQGLSYEGCKVYKVVKGLHLEMGDVTLNNGRGGYSIYGANFPQEGHTLKHSKPGVLSMVAVDKTLNNSKFAISLNAIQNMDTKRVVFGRVVKGMKTVYHIQDLGGKFVGAPIVPIIITKCGEIKYNKSFSRILFGRRKKKKQ